MSTFSDAPDSRRGALAPSALTGRKDATDQQRLSHATAALKWREPHFSEPYERAMGKIEEAGRTRERLADEQIRHGWASGAPLLAIADVTGLHYAQVMDRVRELALPERHPTLLEPLDPDLLAH